MINLTRTLLTAIFLTLCSQTAWAVDCNYVLKETEYLLSEHKRLENKKDDLIGQSIASGAIKFTNSEQQKLDWHNEAQLKYLESLNKWATVYRTFCQ